jgi:hypothetical protein
MKKTNYLLLLPIALMLLTASCGKDGAVGPTGPIGPTGPQGAAGVSGTAGTNGTKGATGTIGATGATGTANVIYSDWVTPATYTKDTVFDAYHFYADIPASKITQAILDGGTVLVYGKLDGYNSVIWPTAQVSPLPISITYEFSSTPGSTIYTDFWSALCTLGNIRIDFVDNQNYYGSISNAHQFRYIIIPGGVHTLGSINPRNYEQVKQALHLPN